MFKKAKHLIIGFVLGASVMCFIPGFAANNQVTAIFNDLSIKIDGKIINSTDKPITLNNRTYLPVRPIAENLGASVSFDQTNQIVEIKSKYYIESKKPVTPDGITVETFDGKKYVDHVDVKKKLNERGYNLSVILRRDMPNLKPCITKDGVIILDNIDEYSIDGFIYLEYDYYIKTILPITK